MQTARLHLVAAPRPCQRERYAEDRNRLLWAAAQKTRNTYARPLDALPDLFRLLGYRLGRKSLGPDRWGQLEHARKIVWVCADLADKLEYRAAVREVEAFTLAHELAHLRLHLRQIIQGRTCRQLELEADEYAGVFLVPRRHLVGVPQFRGGLMMARTPAEVSTAVTVLARLYGISRQAMLVQLEFLRIVEMDRETRQLRLIAA